ncbi:hypothetical protein KIL84_019528 [Mauremys mutica]|uniref:Uncharacterized protein n=1 Tax=Mauremys mutica TaxID=74926 RepID=A0A9D4BBB8_9SAUR|nr:hypothetical protein KIL84_019528 [Mauremys mutica]
MWTRLKNRLVERFCCGCIELQRKYSCISFKHLGDSSKAELLCVRSKITLPCIHCNDLESDSLCSVQNRDGKGSFKFLWSLDPEASWGPDWTPVSLRAAQRLV